MPTPNPVRRRAKALRAKGLTYAQIGEKLGVSRTTASRLLNPQYRAAPLKTHHERWATDPSYREMMRGYRRLYSATARARVLANLRATNKIMKSRRKPQILSDVETLLAADTGRCHACGGLQTGGRRLCLDHNHATGKFRGWLCTACNVAYGLLKDSPRRVEQLLEYANAR
jgi:hypothetical protein